MTTSAPPKFEIKIASSRTTPLFEYFQTKPLSFKVSNITGEIILIRSVTLKFKPDTGAVPNYIDQECGIRLGPNRTSTITIDITPTPLFQAATNEFEIALKYHFDKGGRLSEPFTEHHPHFYVIINEPRTSLGQVFISFKQPEDQRLANILERYAKRAGFSPKLFVRHPDLGEDQWKSIENHISTSHSAFIIWARRTEWGEGVEREVGLCRSHGVKEILLIENDLELPSIYRGTNHTYKRFDPVEPAVDLSEAVASLRQQLIKPA